MRKMYQALQEQSEEPGDEAIESLNSKDTVDHVLE